MRTGPPGVPGPSAPAPAAAPPPPPLGVTDWNPARAAIFSSTKGSGPEPDVRHREKARVGR